MSSNNASVVVQFGSASNSSTSSSHLSAEIDTRAGGLNAGKTTFQPGDSVAILVYKTPDVTISQVEASSGSISNTGSVNVSKVETLTFANTREASIDIPAIGGVLESVEWMGNNLGAITLTGTRAVSAISGVGVAKVVYSALADVYTLVSPSSLNGSTDYSIAAVIVGEVP
jgi:hypothetical protein